MPVDFLKLVSSSPQLRKTLEAHSDLTWKMGVEKIKSSLTGEISTTMTKEVDGIIVKFFDHKVEILLKPHYMFNNNQHNANDFDMISCIRILKDFAERFHLNPSALSVINIEYGVNLSTAFDIRMLVDSLEYHQKNKFLTDNLHVFSKKSASIGANNRFSDYKMIKAYAKSIQFPEYTKGNVFRFEVKSKKSRFINSLHVYTLTNLLYPKIYFQLGTSLIEEFDKVLFLDSQLIHSVYNASEIEKLSTYSNPHVWEGYKRQHRNTFLNHKKRYEMLSSRSPNSLKSTLARNLHAKIKLLLSEVGCAESHLL